MKYRDFSGEEVAALQTLHCCANAIGDNLPKLKRRMKSAGLGRMFGLLSGAAAVVTKCVWALLMSCPDEDKRFSIQTRMSRLHLQFGHVRKHPEDLVMMTTKDAETLLAPVLEKCDLECPCSLEACGGNQKLHEALVKSCETRKALKRIGVSEVGLSMECPYQMMVR